MRIAYIGTATGSSLHRAHALERLGHAIALVDPWAWLARPVWAYCVLYQTGYPAAGLRVGRRVYREVGGAAPDLIWINQCEFLGPRLVRRLHDFRVPIVNYANDNPFSTESSRRFRRYRAALPYYDLVVVVFAHVVAPARVAGARLVIRTHLSADGVAHRPRPLTEAQLRLRGSVSARGCRNNEAHLWQN